MRTEEGMKKAKEARAAYHKENIRTLATNVNKEKAERFASIAEAFGMTPSKMLRHYVDTVIESGTPWSDPNRPLVTYVTAEIEERLKHECAFHNPKHHTPTEIMNDILKRYFEFVDEVRK